MAKFYVCFDQSQEYNWFVALKSTGIYIQFECWTIIIVLQPSVDSVSMTNWCVWVNIRNFIQNTIICIGLSACVIVNNIWSCKPHIVSSPILKQPTLIFFLLLTYYLINFWFEHTCVCRCAVTLYIAINTYGLVYKRYFLFFKIFVFTAFSKFLEKIIVIQLNCFRSWDCNFDRINKQKKPRFCDNPQLNLNLNIKQSLNWKLKLQILDTKKIAWLNIRPKKTFSKVITQFI